MTLHRPPLSGAHRGGRDRTSPYATAGEIFHDPAGWVTSRREALRWYPDDVWRYVVATAWLRVSQEHTFVGRTGARSDDLGSRVVAARLVRDLMRLTFLLERRWAPYSKCLGRAFANLHLVDRIGPHLTAALSANRWREREAELCVAATHLGEATNDLGLAAVVDPNPRRFHDRDIRVTDAEGFTAALCAAITDSTLWRCSSRRGVATARRSGGCRARSTRPSTPPTYSPTRHGAAMRAGFSPSTGSPASRGPRQRTSARSPGRSPATGMTRTGATMLFDELARIAERPAPFSTSTIETLWTDPHVSEQLLRYHLDPGLDSASRRHEFIDRSVAWLADRFALGPGRRVVDLGCGPGLYANRLAATGAQVTGVDLSPRSVDHARRAADAAGVDVDYVVADYLDDPPAGPFDLALLIYCDLCPLAPEARARLLDNVRGLLADDGALVFDVVSLARFLTLEEGSEFAPSLMDGFWSAEPYFGFHSVFTYEAEQVVLDRYDIVERDRSWSVSNWLQHYTPDTLEAELDRAGFEVVELLGDVAGAPYDHLDEEFAVVTRPR